jgi:uncharacterized damage-inducible protein DinB
MDETNGRRANRQGHRRPPLVVRIQPVITSVAAFVRYFDGVNRRAMRDVGMLPEAAESWRPPAGAGEDAWGIGELVGHLAASRLFFARAFVGEGWHAEPWAGPVATRADWQSALSESGATLAAMLSAAPDQYLERKLEPMMEGDPTISGWRGLMLMAEHDIHHRSQIDAYAGVMGWPVAHIFGRSAEEVGLAKRPDL